MAHQERAGIAQVAERGFRKSQVVGANPTVSFLKEFMQKSKKRGVVTFDKFSPVITAKPGTFGPGSVSVKVSHFADDVEHLRKRFPKWKPHELMRAYEIAHQYEP